jgi:AraC family transcriptional regulator
MPRMTKKTSKMTEADSPAAIVAKARALAEPADFYRGRKRTGHELPDNILLFHRANAAALRNPSIGKAFHQRHVLIVPLVGSGRVVTDMNALALEPGTCALIPPFHFHHYTGFASANIEWLFITFAYATVAPQRGVPVATTATSDFWPLLAAVVRDFEDRHDPASADRLSWRLALLLDQLRGGRRPAKDEGERAAGDQILATVSALAAERLSTPISLDEIARTLGLSASHLRQQFLRAAGVSLGRFLREFRLRHAAEILAAGRANVTEAAAICGWDTPYAFSRAFRNYWGRAPKSFALERRRIPAAS